MIRDMNGHLVPLGRTWRMNTENFLGATALPSWITLVGGSSSIVQPGATTAGYLEVSSATQGELVEVNLVPVDLRAIKEAWIGVDSLDFSHGQGDIEVRFGVVDGLARGAFVTSQLDDADATTRLKAFTGSVETSVKPAWNFLNNGEYRRPKNIRFVLRSDGWAALMLDDNVAFAHPFVVGTEIDFGGALTPTLRIRNKTAGTKWVRVSQISQAVVHD